MTTTPAYLHFSTGTCTLGAILLAASPLGVSAIKLGDDPDLLIRDLQREFPKATLVAQDGSRDAWLAAVVGFIEAPRLGLELPLDMRGTVFQMRVWRALQAIPVGQTATYTEIARQIGAPKAVRAVANACGANKLALAIPCHRVVRAGYPSGGGLGGYRWGIERKRELLKREGGEK